MKNDNFFSFLFLAAISMIGLFPREANCLEASDFLVRGLEELEPAFSNYNGTMHAGLLPIDNIHDDEQQQQQPRGKLSFWLFTPQDAHDSLTVWLNGGPGCSSYGAGMLLECGPVTHPHHPAGHGRTSADQPLLPNEWSWTRATNLLFVEQPTGVGYSYGPEVQTEEDLSRDFYHFLGNFFDTFPNMRSKRLYIVGESYAGMYVPSMAHYIHQQNQNGATPIINLSGIALGNGWIDAMTQGPAVIDYAYWHGMIDSTTKDGLWRVWRKCEQKMHLEAPFHDFSTTDECAIVEAVLAAAGSEVFPEKDHYGPNQYDVTTWDTYPVLTTPVTAATTFMNDPQVKKALHFDEVDVEWQSCIPGAGRRRRLELLQGQTLLRHDQPESVAPYIAELLDKAGIRVLVYAGDRDLSVNLQGSEQVLNNMEWSGASEWKDSNRYLWMIDEDVAGYAKTHKNLDMLLVLNSGHLVPYNVPISSLDLITRLVGELPFGDILLPKIDFGEEELDDGLESLAVDLVIDRSARAHAFTVLVALSCFLIGTVVGSVQRRRNSDYEKIPEYSIS